MPSHLNGMLGALARDLRYALRALTRDRGFTLVALLVVAVGIGANTIVFSVVNRLLLQPLPFVEPEELVWIRNDVGRSDLLGVASRVDIFEEWVRRSDALDARGWVIRRPMTGQARIARSER